MHRVDAVGNAVHGVGERLVGAARCKLGQGRVLQVVMHHAVGLLQWVAEGWGSYRVVTLVYDAVSKSRREQGGL